MTGDVDRTAPLAATGGRNPAIHCITCSDEGLVLRVLAVECDAHLAHCVDADGEAADVDVALVAPVAPGDALLVHAGVALQRLKAQA